MIHIVERVVIDRPPQEVWAFASNLDRFHEWNKDMVALRKLTEGSTQVGTRALDVRKMMGRTIETTMEFTQYDPPHKLAAKMLDGPMALEFTHRFEPDGAGTQVTAVIEGQMRGLLRPADPLAARWMRGVLAWELNKLKGLVEGQA